MLGKLIKHEFKDTAKLMLLLYALFTVITLIGTIVLSANTRAAQVSDFSKILLIVLMIFYMLSIFALFIVTYVYIAIHFYKTMFSSQGYLTHTLPVKTSTVFHIKLGVSLVWLLCSMALLILSIFLFVWAGTQGAILHVDYSAFTEIAAEFEAEMGMSMSAFFFGLLPFSMLLSCLVFILMVCTSSCIGQLFSKNKVAASVIAGVILYFIEQITSSIFALASNFRFLFIDTENSTATMPPEFLSNTMTISLIWSLCFCIVYYIVCRVILQKHLNLE